MEEYVPKAIPKSKANINPRRFSPPKMKMAKITKMVVNEVLKVLPKVLEMESSNNPANVKDFFSLKYSRILSNTITVSLMEYPRTVNIAAIKSWLISMLNGMYLCSKE